MVWGYWSQMKRQVCVVKGSILHLAINKRAISFGFQMESIHELCTKVQSACSALWSIEATPLSSLALPDLREIEPAARMAPSWFISCNCKENLSSAAQQLTWLLCQVNLRRFKEVDDRLQKSSGSLRFLLASVEIDLSPPQTSSLPDESVPSPCFPLIKQNERHSKCYKKMRRTLLQHTNWSTPTRLKGPNPVCTSVTPDEVNTYNKVFVAFGDKMHDAFSSDKSAGEEIWLEFISTFQPHPLQTRRKGFRYKLCLCYGLAGCTSTVPEAFFVLYYWQDCSSEWKIHHQPNLPGRAVRSSRLAWLRSHEARRVSLWSNEYSYGFES